MHGYIVHVTLTEMSKNEFFDQSDNFKQASKKKSLNLSKVSINFKLSKNAKIEVL
jgi:hypothetical protein